MEATCFFQCLEPSGGKAAASLLLEVPKVLSGHLTSNPWKKPQKKFQALEKKHPGVPTIGNYGVFKAQAFFLPAREVVRTFGGEERFAHQKFVGAARGFASFGDRPDN